ncbi:hypothetical protein GALMADRAFT_272884 [Galerina marginata CBS 339.88]|uniref:Uncharacterized protein n=1 Tax=Galerina marginata (strain CBS 339.88) TaxID=685588 RepID=A0A067SA93_GALM3|nr:hypothetical protein GALMADRAFT_272884 [Galerina marginata CBS 339.88]
MGTPASLGLWTPLMMKYCAGCGVPIQRITPRGGAIGGQRVAHSNSNGSAKNLTPSGIDICRNGPRLPSPFLWSSAQNVLVQAFYGSAVSF